MFLIGLNFKETHFLKIPPPTPIPFLHPGPHTAVPHLSYFA